MHSGVNEIGDDDVGFDTQPLHSQVSISDTLNKDSAGGGERRRPFWSRIEYESLEKIEKIESTIRFGIRNRKRKVGPLAKANRLQ